MKKRIHVRSKDPMRIARQMEKKMEGDGSKSKRSSKGRPPPPQMKVNTICKVGTVRFKSLQVMTRVLYTVGRPVIRKVLKRTIWGVPPDCLGSRSLQ